MDETQATPDLARVLLETLDRAEELHYAGYSKFDGLRSPVTRALSFGAWPLRLAWTQLVLRSPVDLRPVLLVRPGINPEAPALFARASLDAAAAGGSSFPGDRLRDRAARCLDSLLASDSSRAAGAGGARSPYRGSCWGYHHPWQTPGFYQPPGYPNCYLTTIVAGALLHGHRTLGRPEYLAAARSSADFVLSDLPVLLDDGVEKCIGYVPDLPRTGPRALRVININALAGALLADLAAATGEERLAAEARKLMTFVVRRQTDEGAWFYTTDPRQSLVAHDNYHTGMILDALMTLRNTLGDRSFDGALERGLGFYRERLFEPDGAPRWSSDALFPHDAHGSGQGALTFALAGDLATAGRIAAFGVARFYQGNGEFSWQRGRFLRKRVHLLHWSGGWMARGLGALLRAHALAGPDRPPELS